MQEKGDNNSWATDNPFSSINCLQMVVRVEQLGMGMGSIGGALSPFPVCMGVVGKIFPELVKERFHGWEGERNSTVKLIQSESGIINCFLLILLQHTTPYYPAQWIVMLYLYSPLPSSPPSLVANGSRGQTPQSVSASKVHYSPYNWILSSKVRSWLAGWLPVTFLVNFSSFLNTLGPLC